MVWKGTALKTLPSGYHFHAVGDTYAELHVVIQEATTFVLACMDTLKVGILPPTTESFTENAKRAH